MRIILVALLIASTASAQSASNMELGNPTDTATSPLEISVTIPITYVCGGLCPIGTLIFETSGTAEEGNWTHWQEEVDTDPTMEVLQLEATPRFVAHEDTRAERRFNLDLRVVATQVTAAGSNHGASAETTVPTILPWNGHLNITALGGNEYLALNPSNSKIGFEAGGIPRVIEPGQEVQFEATSEILTFGSTKSLERQSMQLPDFQDAPEQRSNAPFLFFAAALIIAFLGRRARSNQISCSK